LENAVLLAFLQILAGAVGNEAHSEIIRQLGVFLPQMNTARRSRNQRT
jgi:hypothetical protein